ncbi:MAG: bifunctional (p)ppGpp synthetase/guanosine-3',5'-bis(diphosphate) 3'-pyrophosphohydrolase [Alphaproteobacteria bacterium]|nr:bifunctional (p)ppGpp synthetase/guanosine-3',5'-bis(diphosphate) 3'-pyrophosphohydrolase [Alphaproteobacteria bacterium]MDE2265824.1 bifunctional (p)ppGpp synthetase/guanosine-3',5'-bis(diphosphate) 3'-pyrophosphohydrolase [Alphaproteobacteria bacterium]MDE2500612.1 bifunctional (p)ppGpp synthetase/guanosine-3',5'-bis(diphosphate) 3'-pyrophosphohydrolase [Alphaproteobacteria bacterium]
MTVPTSQSADKANVVPLAPPRSRGRRKLMRQTELVDRVKAYDPDADEALLNKAYVYAMKAHGKQFRASGDPYFAHPLEVAAILTDLKLDEATIATALLHDTIEDTLATYDDIKANFGQEIADLVDGVTKLSALELFSERTKQAENFRKLMLAMSNDIRVLLVKLADRAHNMRTLSFIQEPEKRRRIAQETFDIYAPLAGRIGMQHMREELEDLAFAELHQEARNSIVTRLARLDASSGKLIDRIADQLKRKLAEHGIEAWVYGRSKRPFSIWRKLQDKQLNFEQLSDIFGFRVIVGSKDDCYRALGALHTSWQAVPARFKDFISTPKPNGYQSLHTTVIGPEKQRVEVQVRTQEMHDIAERGVAAHWRYRDVAAQPGEGHENRAYGWLREMVELLERGNSPEEFLEHSRLNLYQDQVFCFTPKGDLIPLPRGATPIDFAYQVHTNLGHHTVGAKVNGTHVPLYTPLRNGDQVEIISSKEQTPSPLWEQFVVTGRARIEIRRFLRQAQRGEHINFGRKILEKVFSDEGYELTDKAVDGVAKKLRFAKADDVFAEVGRGVLRGHEVLEAVYPELKRDPERRKQAVLAEPPGKPKAISIRGLTEGVAYRLGNCCHPLPGDRIVGLMMPGEGAVIHTIDCAELERAQSTMDDWLDVAWGHHAAEMGPSVARLEVRVKNAPGSLGAAMTAIGNSGGNIFNMKTTNRNPLYFEFQVDIEVRDVAHLQNILGALRVTAAVESVDRVRGPEEPASASTAPA